MPVLKQILLVEDSPEDLELTLQALQSHRVANEIAVARDGVEALEYLQRRGRFSQRPPGHPAFVLLDIKLPKLNGLEVLRLIREDANLKRIPVVLITSSREAPDIAKGYDLGANGYVVKPVDFSEFTNAVKQIGAFWGVLNQPPPDRGPTPE